ncbi:hypothetical protein PSAC2689_10203 [Paraburkholderia sacchari]
MCVPSRYTLSSGCSRCHSSTRGASHFDTSEGSALTLRLRVFFARSISACATRRLSKAAAQLSWYCLPIAVSRSRLPSFCVRCIPSVSSSSLICWLTAPAEMPSRRAASVMPPHRPTASKTCSARNGGKLFVVILLSLESLKDIHGLETLNEQAGFYIYSFVFWLFILGTQYTKPPGWRQRNVFKECVVRRGMGRGSNA